MSRQQRTPKSKLALCAPLHSLNILSVWITFLEVWILVVGCQVTRIPGEGGGYILNLLFSVLSLILGISFHSEKVQQHFLIDYLCQIGLIVFFQQVIVISYSLDDMITMDVSSLYNYQPHYVWLKMSIFLNTIIQKWELAATHTQKLPHVLTYCQVLCE